MTNKDELIYKMETVIEYLKNNNGYNYKLYNHLCPGYDEPDSNIIEYAEDIKFLTGDSSELEEVEEKKKSLVKEWDNLVWTDKQYKAPTKRYKMKKKPKILHLQYLLIG